MNKIIIITRAEEIGRYYCEELRNFFGDTITIDWMICKDKNIKLIYDYDMILLSQYNIINNIKEHINPKTKVIKIIKNIHPEGLKKINEIPYGSRALVVNVGPKSVSDSIHLIYSHGRTDLDLYPYYPGIKDCKDLHIVITQGEREIIRNMINYEDREIIDIYNTSIDVQVYLEIIIYFELEKKKYMKELMGMSIVESINTESLSYMMNERFLLDNVINSLFENLNEGIIIYDMSGEVTSCSDSVQNFINLSITNIIGRNITDLIPIENKVSQLEKGEAIVKISNNPFICNIIPNMTIGRRDYGLIILKKYTDVEMKMFKYKQELMKKGFKAKYDIENIIGTSNIMRKLKDITIRMAKSESTVLITGESGTGKELFAHAIHNSSIRSKMQFVAINCASIPENLLESELFGYEEGAFTGAIKGGKKGIFEMANYGTLFLDEIGELPLHLQNRLLRVLQEKEFTKIGGSRVLTIDVRIIAATNVDIKKQVEEGKFRRDLYYRLNVLPLNIPPLRLRENDVIEIFDKMRDDFNIELILSKEVKEYFLNYKWDGNVRELKNCVEYLMSLGKKKIYYDDLPETMRDSACSKQSYEIPLKSNNIDINILKILRSENRRQLNIGRKGISEKLAKSNIFLGEQEVRERLISLEEKGLVNITKGRGGTKITNKGIDYINS